MQVDGSPDFRPVTSEVAGSSPVVPAIPLNHFQAFFLLVLNPCVTENSGDQFHCLPPHRRREVLVLFELAALVNREFAGRPPEIGSWWPCAANHGFGDS